LEKIYSLLPAKEKSQSKISDLIELEITKNEQFVRKRFFKLKIKNDNIIHLTCGKNLESVYEHTKSFHSTFPSISCRPLFFVNDTEIDLLAQEFFDGEPIDENFDKNRINEDNVKNILEIIKREFLKQTKSSNQEVYAKEFKEFSASILKNKKIKKLDKEIIQTYLLPSIESGLLIEKPMIRLSSGDLSARNILVNINKDFRIIDCEFALKTHLFEEDWIRLATFCSKGFRQIPYIQNMVQSLNPFLHSYLRLRQTILNQEVFSNEKSDFTLCEDLVNSILTASNISKDTNISQPIILKGFENSINQSNYELIELKYQKKSQEKVLNTKIKELDALRNNNDLNIAKLKSMNGKLFLEKKENEKKVNDLIKDLDSTHEKLVLEKQISERMQNQIDKQKSLHLTTINQLKDEKNSKFLIAKELEETKQNLNKTYSNLEVAKDKIKRMQMSFSWKCTSVLRLLRRTTIEKFKNKKNLSNPKYSSVIEERFSNLVDKEMFHYQPLISIIMPVYNTDENFLIEAINSVLEQNYKNFELCIADDKSTKSHIKKILNSVLKNDVRVKVIFREKSGNISEATKSAISLSTGDFISFLDHDDLLHKNALHEVVYAINQNPNIKLIYTDENKLSEDGSYVCPYYKPDWNYNLFLSQNYLCHFVVIKKSIYENYGCFRQKCDGAQDWDNLLHIITHIDEGQIFHIPKILYHWRIHKNSTAKSVDTKGNAINASLIALNDFCHREKIDAKVNVVEKHYFHVSHRIKNPLPLVTIIIPSRNNEKLLRKCISSIQIHTSYKNFKIVIVDNSSDEVSTIQYLKSLKNDISIINYNGEFNHSAINNLASRLIQSDYLLFLNDDTEIINSNWLTSMVSSIQQKDVAIVGCKLLYPNRKIQHAGVIIGIGDFAGHAFRHLDENSQVMGSRLHLKQNFSAVTAACMLIKKNVFQEVNGFDEINLPTSYNDVDLCLRVGALGYKTIYEPVTVIHHESASRGKPKTILEEKALSFMKFKWNKIFLRDPSYNPNLSRVYEDFSV
jgi:O-antigen biosynthesis protein